MFYQGQMMNFQNVDSCGCSCGCPQAVPTCQQCNQVVQTCNVTDVPHYINYHTHVVNNCIKRHINIPTYSTSTENVYVDEYVQGQPVIQNPAFMQSYPAGPQYQGNVGVEGINPQTNPTPTNVAFPPYGSVPFGM